MGREKNVKRDESVQVSILKNKKNKTKLKQLSETWKCLIIQITDIVVCGTWDHQRSDIINVVSIYMF